MSATKAGSTNLLAGLSKVERRRLKKLRRQDVQPVAQRSAALASALDPWMTMDERAMSSAEGETQRAATVERIANEEPNAQRSLMHRCAPSLGRLALEGHQCQSCADSSSEAFIRG